MQVKDEIFNEFISKLENSEDFPESLLNELKAMWESDELSDQKKILECIRKYHQNDNKDR